MSVLRVEDLLARKISRFKTHFDPKRSSDYSLKDLFILVINEENGDFITLLMKMGFKISILNYIIYK